LKGSNLTTSDSTKTYHNQVKKFFEGNKARETKFTQRESLINGSVFLMSLVMVVFQHGAIVLDLLAKTAAKIDPKVKVTGQAFKERFNTFAVAFLKSMFAEALKMTVPQADRVVPLLSDFAAVYILDSSIISLPESLKQNYQGYGGVATKAAAKVYLLLNWLTGGYEKIQIEAGRKADQNMGENFLPGSRPGALWLFDLGFFKAAYLAMIASYGSFYLCRLAASQQIFWSCSASGKIERLDFDLLLRRAPRQLFEIKVIFGHKQEVEARLVIAPVPPQVAAERRRKVHKAARKQGRTPTQTTLSRCDWTLLLTNAGPEQLPTSTVLEVYCVRWQVELVFKLFKSDAKLEATNAKEKNRLECEVYAKLIALLLFNRISRLVEEYTGEVISPVKLWRSMRDDKEDWLKMLGQSTAQAISDLVKYLSRYARTSSRKKYPSTLQCLARAAEKAQQVILNDPLVYLRERLKTAAERSRAFARHLSRRTIITNSERFSCQRATLLN
jgi:hypothetical protein